MDCVAFTEELLTDALLRLHEFILVLLMLLFKLFELRGEPKLSKLVWFAVGESSLINSDVSFKFNF